MFDIKIIDDSFDVQAVFRDDEQPWQAIDYSGKN